MTIGFSNDPGQVSLGFEVSGPLTVEDVTQIVEQLDGDEVIERISFEIRAETPATISVPELNQEQPPPDSDEVDGDRDDAEEHIVGVDELNSRNRTTDTPPRLQPGSGPFDIVRVVDENGEWMRTREIVQTFPDDWEMNENALRSNLWNLENRGLIEKRPYHDDNRQNEYRITEVGKLALENAIERTEDAQPAQ